MRSIFQSRLRMAPFLVLLVLAVAACQQAGLPNTGQAAHTLNIKAADFSFEAPDQIPAGLTTVSLENTGKESHHAQILKLNEGVTLEQFQAALQQGEGPALALVTAPGGPALLSPGHHGEVTLDLDAGQYVLVCLVPSPDGIPHVAKGMLKPLQVVADGTQAAGQEPKADQNVTLKDFTIILPEGIKSGKQVWKVTNEGPQLHEMVILKLAPGKTMQDVAAYSAAPSGTPPYEEIGGMQALTPGDSGWVSLDLPAGEYVLLCFVPDPASGAPHMQMGMITPLSIK